MGIACGAAIRVGGRGVDLAASVLCVNCDVLSEVGKQKAVCDALGTGKGTSLSQNTVKR